MTLKNCVIVLIALVTRSTLCEEGAFNNDNLGMFQNANQASVQDNITDYFCKINH